jgi:hypothetical protein
MLTIIAEKLGADERTTTPSRSIMHTALAHPLCVCTAIDIDTAYAREVHDYRAPPSPNRHRREKS